MILPEDKRENMHNSNRYFLYIKSGVIGEKKDGMEIFLKIIVLLFNRLKSYIPKKKFKYKKKN